MGLRVLSLVLVMSLLLFNLLLPNIYSQSHLYPCLPLLYHLLTLILITLLVVVHYVVLLFYLLLCLPPTLFFPFPLPLHLIFVLALRLNLNGLPLIEIPPIILLQLLNQLLFTPLHLALILLLPHLLLLPPLQLNIHPPQFNRLNLILSL